MSTALAFLWPVKKVSKDSVDKKPAQKQSSILELADNLFENSHYNECLDLLSDVEVFHLSSQSTFIFVKLYNL